MGSSVRILTRKETLANFRRYVESFSTAPEGVRNTISSSSSEASSTPLPSSAHSQYINRVTMDNGLDDIHHQDSSEDAREDKAPKDVCDGDQDLQNETSHADGRSHEPTQDGKCVHVSSFDFDKSSTDQMCHQFAEAPIASGMPSPKTLAKCADSTTPAGFVSPAHLPAIERGEAPDQGESEGGEGGRISSYDEAWGITPSEALWMLVKPFSE